jgi:fumarylacetoacetase
MPGGEERAFVNDGDSIIISGYAGSLEDGAVGFGECRGTILPAL